jgi:hypothetical protein
VVNSLALKGKIVRQPWLPTGTLGTTKQDGFLAYDLKCVLRNPKDPNQTITLVPGSGRCGLTATAGIS